MGQDNGRGNGANENARYDVVIAGASLAGCTAAVLFARRGLRVAVVERNSDPKAYKKTCTHFVQPSATPTLFRLGLVPALEAAGAVRNSIDAYALGEWVPWTLDPAYWGYTVRRSTLDPMLRALAAETPGVELFLGWSLATVRREGARVTGIDAEHKKSGATRSFRARLVVGADGRHGKTGDLAGVPAASAPNNRFFYLTYYKNLSLATGDRSQAWLMNPDIAYAFPCDDGRVVVGAMPTKDKLPAWKADPEREMVRFFASLPLAPRLRDAERVADFYGMLELPNHSRPASAPGVAFVGDAAMTADPALGIGCGWAFQSAAWLADHAGDALCDGDDPAALDAALVRYRDAHAEALGEHYKFICGQSLAKPFNVLERALVRAAARDAEMARGWCALSARLIKPTEYVNPVSLARLGWINLTRKPRDYAPLVSVPAVR
jgi:flavin-dependent dehydrogenase